MPRSQDVEYSTIGLETTCVDAVSTVSTSLGNLLRHPVIQQKLYFERWPFSRWSKRVAFLPKPSLSARDSSSYMLYSAVFTTASFILCAGFLDLSGALSATFSSCGYYTPSKPTFWAWLTTQRMGLWFVLAQTYPRSTIHCFYRGFTTGKLTRRTSTQQASLASWRLLSKPSSTKSTLPRGKGLQIRSVLWPISSSFQGKLTKNEFQFTLTNLKPLENQIDARIVQWTSVLNERFAETGFRMDFAAWSQ